MTHVYFIDVDDGEIIRYHRDDTESMGDWNLFYDMQKEDSVMAHHSDLHQVFLF